MSAVRDLVVIGASAGGLSVLRRLFSELPGDLDATVLVVLHQAGWAPPSVISSLRRQSKLEVQWGEDRSEIRAGCVYLAPPDRHMTLAREGRELAVFHGPRENLARPSINTLFRSAAAERSGRTIAMLLSGLLDDGVAGLDAVKQCGGVVLVQDPADAAYPDMPRAAIDAVATDAIVPSAALASVLVQAVGTPAPDVEVPREIAIGARLAGPRQSHAQDVQAIGSSTGLSCPECGGPVWEVGDGAAKTYRCHVGHAHSTRVLMQTQDEELERSLWLAVRTLEERASVLERLANEHRTRNHQVLSRSFAERAKEARQHAHRVRRLFVDLLPPLVPEDEREPR